MRKGPAAERPLRVTHVITGLDTGGAEMMLYKLLSQQRSRQRLRQREPAPDRLESEVISLTSLGEVGREIEALGVRVRALGMRRGLPDPVRLLKLSRWLREGSPDVVQTWMYHADLAGGLAAKLAGGIPVAWNIRHSQLDLEHGKRTTIRTAKACAFLSGVLPARIVCNAEVSREVHERLGYEAKKMVVIPNGFDLSSFKPDPAARRSVREELGIPEGAPLIGLVARFNPQKDHQNFVRAAALLRARMPDARFLLCGTGVTRETPDLAGWIKAEGLQDSFYLLGRRGDVPRLDAALDVATSSSYSGEGFPNVVGEAMACGVPCVVTDVGDSATIVGETGVVVPPRDPEALAGGWHELLRLGSDERRTLGEKARRRVEERYSLGAVAGAYEDLYRELSYAEEGLTSPPGSSNVQDSSGAPGGTGDGRPAVARKEFRMRGYATARRYVARYVKEQRLIEIPLEKRRLGKVPIVPCDTGSLASLDPLALDEFFASRAVEEEWAEAERSLAAFDVPEATSGVNPGDRRAVYYLARWLKPASILEVGTSVGASMVHLALALRRLREETGSAVGLTTVDNRAVNDPVSRPWRQAGTSHSPREMAEGLGCGDFVTFVTDTSMSYLSAPGRPGFDLIFLDGSHAAATVYKEVPAALSLLNAGGTLLMHDYFPGLEPLWPNGRVIPGPYLAVERLKSEGADLEVLPLGSLPWATKLGTNITSLALLSRGRATS